MLTHFAAYLPIQTYRNRLPLVVVVIIIIIIKQENNE